METVYKLWNTLAECWHLSHSKLGGAGAFDGKTWNSPAHMKSAITYKLPSQVRFRHNPEQAKKEYNSLLDLREVVIYEVKEIERVPLKEWYERQGGLPKTS